MKILLLLFCFLLQSNSRVFVHGACTIEGDPQTTLIILIEDTEVDTNIYEGTYDGTVKSCSANTDIQNEYFKVYTKDTKLIIDTTPEFGNFDQDTPKTAATTIAVNLNCVFECPNENQVVIQIHVMDTNNHEPEFKSASYEFKVPIPLMPLTDFTIYGTDRIIATDVDFSNQNITFTIEPDDFSITTVGTSNGKDYTASFASKSILNIVGSKIYELTATDAGNPSKSSKVIVNIVVDNDLSLDIPVFKELSYSFNYSIENDTPTLTPQQDDILLVTNKLWQLTLELSGDYFSNFIVIYPTESDNIEFDVMYQLPEDLPPIIVLRLTATTDYTTATSLIIYTPSSC